MIGKLTGRVDEKTAESVIIDVQGVGYVVSCGAATLEKLPARGEIVSLTIETHVRDDAIRLYGFASAAEREWFRLLQSVQGVGAKVALSVLSVAPGDLLPRAIAAGDKALIGKAAGVGPKLAQRIVAELKEKVPGIAIVAPLPAARGTAREKPQPAAEAVSALVNLGYGQLEAADAIAAAIGANGAAARVEELIRMGLKELAR